MSMATRRSNVSSKTMPVVAAIAALLLIVSHDAAADGCSIVRRRQSEFNRIGCSPIIIY